MAYLNEDGLATLVGKIKGQMVQLTSEEYQNLPSSKNSDNKIYFVEDEDYGRDVDDEPTANSDNLVKSGGVYNSLSNLSANVQNMFRKRNVSGATTTKWTNVQALDITAPTVDGYDFFCWIGLMTSGSVHAGYITDPFNASSTVYIPNCTSSVNVVAYCLLIKNSY